MVCIAKTSVAESRDETANNVQSGLALPAVIWPSSARRQIRSSACSFSRRPIRDRGDDGFEQVAPNRI